MQATITVQLEQELLASAQNYARQQGTSVSQLVIEFFARLAQQQELQKLSKPGQAYPLFTPVGLEEGAATLQHYIHEGKL